MWRTATAVVFCAALVLPATGQDTRPHHASRMLNPQRLTRNVALVDGRDLQFRRLGAEGLRTLVAQIVQDDRGFLWFGTARGLYRYDGHELRVFRHDARQSGSLSGVVVYSLLRDRTNTLWVGSDGFLDRLDSQSETFTPQPVTAQGGRLGPINVSCMTQDSSGMLWLCTRSGLYRVDPRTQSATVLRHRPGHPSSLSGDAIQFVGEDRRGALWVGTAAGLDVLDRSSQETTSHLPLPEASRAMALHEDRFGVFWIIHGADGRLAVFDKSANALTTWQPTPVAAGGDPVMFSSLLEDRAGTMWFGTLNHGILKFDRDRDRFVRYTTDPSNPHSLSDRRVNVLYQDQEGLVWAGLHQSEPNYFLPQPPFFRSLQAAAGQPTLVSAILQDSAGLVWLGLDRGVRMLDRKTGLNRDVPALRGDETTSAVEGAPGVLWFGTAGRGLRQLDQRTGRVRTFRHQPRRATSLPSDFVEQVKVDRHGAIWAVTWRGLARWEPVSAQFVTVMPVGAPQELTLHTATFARNGIVWIGSNLGLHRFDPAAQRFQWFRHDKSAETSLSNDRVNSIHEAADGSIWIGTQAGLDHWDANGTAIRRYTHEDGLPGGTVSCILEDDARQLWMSTDLGIARLDPATGRFKTYGTADGLPGLNMTGWDACARAESGEMFFAGFAGAVAFFPRTVVDRDYVPPVVITRLRLLDATQEVNGTRASAIPAGRTSEITLRPSQSTLSVEFAALSFLSPDTNRFRYRLQGLQEEWTEVRSDQRVATYVALPPGSYSFQVQGATEHGSWSPSAATLRIVKLPPWWKTWPFYLLASGLVGVTLFMAYRMRLRQLTHSYNVRLEERWAERTRIARELHDTLLQGFQGLMFRFQAVRELLPAQPAKAIPVLDTALLKGEEVIDEARSAVSDLRSAERVDRDLDAGLAALAAEAAHFSLEGRAPAWELVTKGRVREIPGTVLYELYQVAQEAISNAFRHARADNITVEVCYGRDGLRITVADDGAGFDEALLSSERYPGHFGVQGMVERIERLGGGLALRSRPGQGTRIVLSVPATVAYRKAPSAGGGPSPWWRVRGRSGGRD